MKSIGVEVTFFSWKSNRVSPGKTEYPKHMQLPPEARAAGMTTSSGRLTVILTCRALRRQTPHRLCIQGIDLDYQDCGVSFPKYLGITSSQPWLMLPTFLCPGAIKHSTVESRQSVNGSKCASLHLTWRVLPQAAPWGQVTGSMASGPQGAYRTQWVCSFTQNRSSFVERTEKQHVPWMFLYNPSLPALLLICRKEGHTPQFHIWQPVSWAKTFGYVLLERL